MKERALKDIMNSLQEEEGVENRLISLYLALLDAGVENCLPANLSPSFRVDLEKLYQESEGHKKAISNLIGKHKT